MNTTQTTFNPYRLERSEGRHTFFEDMMGIRKMERATKEMTALLTTNAENDTVFEKFSELLNILKENPLSFEQYEKDFSETVFSELSELYSRDSARLSALIKEMIDLTTEREALLHIWLAFHLLKEDTDEVKNFIPLLGKATISEIAKDHYGFIIYTAYQKNKINVFSKLSSVETSSVVDRVGLYYERVTTRLRIRNVAYDLVSEAKNELTTSLNKTSTELHQLIDYKFNYLQKQRDEDIENIGVNIKFSDNKFNEELKSQSKSNIQLLSLFTAVLAFIIVNVQVFTNYTFIGALFLCIALGLGLVNFIIVIDIFINKEKWEAKYKIGLVIALLVMLLAMPFFAQKYYASIPSNIFVQDKKAGEVIIQSSN